MKKKTADLIPLIEVFTIGGKNYVKADQKPSIRGTIKAHPVELREGLFFAQKKVVDVFVCPNESVEFLGWVSPKKKTTLPFFCTSRFAFP